MRLLLRWRAAEFEQPAPPAWTMSWLASTINAQQGHLDSAIENFRSVLGTRIPSRKFDFSRDYTVINEIVRYCFSVLCRYVAIRSVPNVVRG